MDRIAKVSPKVACLRWGETVEKEAPRVEIDRVDLDLLHTEIINHSFQTTAPSETAAVSLWSLTLMDTDDLLNVEAFGL